MKKVMVAAVGIGVLLTAGCGSDDSSSAEGDQATAEVAAASVTSAAPQPQGTSPGVYRVGESIDNGGVSVTVTSVETVPAVPVSGGDRTAPEGRRFVVVAADVANDMTTPVDVSCGDSIGTRLLDGQKQQYNVIADLAAVEGNSPCGDALAPGADGTVRWVFDVPADSVPKAFAFLNKDGSEPTAVKVVNLSVN